MTRGPSPWPPGDRVEPLANPTRSAHKGEDTVRHARSIFAALLLMAVSATPALATPPERGPLELGDFDFAAGEACSFAVHVDFLVNREKVTSFYDRNGDVARILTTGSLVVKLSPVDDPEHTVTVNISGPSRQVFHADGTSTLTYSGRSISLYPPGTLVLTAGQAVVELDNAGAFVSVTNIGFESDLCLALGG